MLTLEHLFHSHGDNTLVAVATIVGHDNHLVAGSTHFVLKDDEVLGTACQYTDHAVTGLFHGTDNGEQGGGTHTATGAQHGSILLDVSGLAQRTNHVMQTFTRFQGTDLACAVTHTLDNQRNGAGLGVTVSDGQRNAFTFFTGTDNHEMSCTARLGDEGSLNDKLGHVSRKLLFTNDFVHWFLVSY